jgi:hypothetical protein
MGDYTSSRSNRQMQEELKRADGKTTGKLWKTMGRQRNVVLRDRAMGGGTKLICIVAVTTGSSMGVIIWRFHSGATRKASSTFINLHLLHECSYMLVYFGMTPGEDKQQA